MYENNVAEAGPPPEDKQTEAARQERRHSPRRRLSMLVVATIGGRRRLVQTLDVGPRGAFVEYDGNPEWLDPVELEVTPPGGAPLIRRGVVARHVSTAEAAEKALAPGIGIEFFDDNPAWERIVAGGVETTSAAPQPPGPCRKPNGALSRSGSSARLAPPSPTSAPVKMAVSPRLYRIAPADPKKWEALMEQFLDGGGIRLREVQSVALPTPAVVVAVDPETSHEWFLPGTALPTSTTPCQSQGVLLRFSPSEFNYPVP